MILITVSGRLAAAPELKLLPGGGKACEFRVLSSRFAAGKEHTEGVNFVAYGELAERLSDGSVKGQQIELTGTQETRHWTGTDGSEKSFTRFQVTWFQKGFKPRALSGRADEEPHGQREPPRYEPRSAPRPRSQAPTQGPGARPPAGRDPEGPLPGFDDFLG